MRGKRIGREERNKRRSRVKESGMSEKERSSTWFPHTHKKRGLADAERESKAVESRKHVSNNKNTKIFLMSHMSLRY